ncbi:MAG: MATE family efflux transporter [Lachnospiraceae bacterium]|nr:MATE family efflux transporter [Lachnospiraceae bacterium]
MRGLSDMTKGSPTRLLLWFAAPAIIGNMVEQLYLLADRAIVGRYVGADAFSAVGATGALIFMFMSLSIGTQTGIGILVAQHYGAGDQEGVTSSIRNGAYVVLSEAALMTVLALILTEPLLTLLGTPPELMKDASVYMKVYLAGQISIAACFSTFQVLRALGNSRVPMLIVVFSSVLNIGLDLLFVVRFSLGAFGAALASTLSQTVAAILCLIYAFWTISYFREAFQKPGPDKQMLKKTIRLSLPAGAQNIFVYASGSALQWIVNSFGVTAIGAFTATSQTESLIRHIYLGIGSAVAAFTGQNIGAGNTERVKKGAASAAKITLILSLCLAAFFWIFGEMFMGLLVDDEKMVDLAAAGIRITGIFFLSMGGVQILHHFLSGAGDTVYPMKNSAIEAVSRIGLALILTGNSKVGVWGIWITTGLAWTLAALLSLRRYFTGEWREKRLVEEKGL